MRTFRRLLSLVVLAALALCVTAAARNAVALHLEGFRSR